MRTMTRLMTMMMIDDDAVENYDKIDDDDHADENDDQNDGAGQIRRLWQPIKAFLLALSLANAVMIILKIMIIIIIIIIILKIATTTMMMTTLTAMIKIISMKPITAFLFPCRCCHDHQLDDDHS